jgi:hypothetical protein
MISDPNAELDAALEGIDVALLLAGPLGCGKTTHALRLIDGSERSDFLKGYHGTLSRTDAKSLSRKKFTPGGLIVEFATNRLNDDEVLRSTKTFIEVLQRRLNIVGAHTFEIDGWPLFWRYLMRMRGLQFLHFGKVKTLVHYALSSDLQRGVANWKAMLAQCGIENNLCLPHSLDHRKRESSGW